MTPERIAAIREQHRKKAYLDYTDCSLCFEEFPCEVIEALDFLAASRSSEARLREALDIVERCARDRHNDMGGERPTYELAFEAACIGAAALSFLEDIVRAALDGAAAQTPQERSGDAPEG